MKLNIEIDSKDIEKLHKMFKKLGSDKEFMEKIATAVTMVMARMEAKRTAPKKGKFR